MNLLKGMVLGFIAGAIATVTVHEIISFIFTMPSVWTGWGRQSWDMSPNEFGVPNILSGAFWGGLWGALFPVVFGALPTGPLTIKGLVFGIIGPALIGVFVAIPLITHRIPLFFDGDISKIVPVLFILAGFGAAVGWLYGLFAYKRLPC